MDWENSLISPRNEKIELHTVIVIHNLVTQVFGLNLYLAWYVNSYKSEDNNIQFLTFYCFNGALHNKIKMKIDHEKSKN